jgi:hypothetical protein
MPFGNYADFDECVADNQDKDNPEAYCAWLHWKITGEWPGQKTEKDKDGTVQSIILSKDKFPKKEDAIKWADEHGFKTYTSRETENSWRIRQYPPDECTEGGGSFETINITDGVQGVYCTVSKNKQNKKGKGGEKSMDILNKKPVNDDFYSMISRQLKEELGEDCYVETLFPDAAIVSIAERSEEPGEETKMAESLYEIPYFYIDGQYRFGPLKEVELAYVEKKMDIIDEITKQRKALKQDERPPADWWDACISRAESFASDPAAFCGALWYYPERFPAGQDMQDAFGKSAELSGPIISVSKDKTKRIAYAAVLVPGEADSDGEIVTKEKVEDACHEFMDLYQNIDLKHTLNNVGKPIENYLTYSERVVKTLEGDEITLPEGTWVIGSKLDEPTFESVQKGELKGYSIMGIKRAAMKELAKKDLGLAIKEMDRSGELKVALKKTLLRDLGPDWVPVSVAVTDDPAVPKSKWFALKSKQKQKETKEAGFASKLKKVFGGSQNNIPNSLTGSTKEGRKFSSGTIKKLKEAAEALQALVDEAEKEEEQIKKKIKLIKGGKEMELTDEELQKMIGEAVKEEVDPIEERIKNLEAKKSDAKDKEGGAEKDKKAEKDKEDPKPNDEDKELKSVKEKVEALETAVGKIAKVLGVDSSKAIKGQDKKDESEDKDKAEKDFGDRDSWGRKNKK